MCVSAVPPVRSLPDPARRRSRPAAPTARTRGVRAGAQAARAAQAALVRLWTALCLAVLLLAPAHAASWSVDDSAANASTWPWIDISWTGTGLWLADNEVSTAKAMGFSITLGSTSYSSVRISSNGMLQFAGTSTSGTQGALPLNGASGKPAIDAVLMPLWDDLWPGSGDIRHETRGTAPHRVFVVSWINAHYRCGYNLFNSLSCSVLGQTLWATATFQVQIHESGTIVYRYGNVDGYGGAHDGLTNFTNDAGALVGLEVADGDVVQYARNSAVIGNGLTLVWRRNENALAELRFNEAAWSGAAAEVLDSSGNGGHGQAGGLGSARPSTRLVNPADPGSSGSCGYGQFSRASKQFVQLPAGLPNLGTGGDSFTVSAWIRSDDASLPDQRIVIDDEHNSGGWGLSLADGGAGRLRFITRGWSQGSFDTPAVIASGTWYFVAAGIDFETQTKFIRVHSAAGTLLNTTTQSFGETSMGGDSGPITIGGETNAAGLNLLGLMENTAAYAFGGAIDEVRIHRAALTEAQTAALLTQTTACAARLIGRYEFEDGSWSGAAGELEDTAGRIEGPFHGTAAGSPLPSALTLLPARVGTTGSCGYASLPGPASGGGQFRIDGLPVTVASGAQMTVAFWMYWNGGNNQFVVSVGNKYGLFFSGTNFGFNTDNADLYGTSSVGLALGWHHVVAVFTHGSVTANALWIDGAARTLTQRAGSPQLANALLSSTVRVSGYGANTGYRYAGLVDQLRILHGAAGASDVSGLYAETHTCSTGLDHIRIEHASGTGLSCAPSTLTVKACRNADCSTPFIGGVGGTLTASGTAAVSWPGVLGAGFLIVPGLSSTTVNLQVLTPDSPVTLGAGSLTVAADHGTHCTFGSPECAFSAADAALQLSFADHVAETLQTLTITAIKRDEASTRCVPAFALATRTVNFSCAYLDPASGSRALRLTALGLNASGSATAACDAGGRSLPLLFDAQGQATTTLQYADVGRLRLDARYTGSVLTQDNGLTMTGSASAVVRPAGFTVTASTGSGPVAGQNFSATVTAVHALLGATPNFGREASPETVTLGHVRVQPQGAGAVDGTLRRGSSTTTTLGGFSGGAATAGDLNWDEVGRIDLAARLSSGSYLASGQTVAGSTGLGVACAGTCVIPADAVATVHYGTATAWTTLAGRSGSVTCNTATFGSDPAPGLPKTCWYVVTGGAQAGGTGTLGPFRPHHLDTVLIPACGSVFSYGGQAYPVTITARAAGGGITRNYDGGGATSPAFARTLGFSLVDATLGTVLDLTGLGTLLSLGNSSPTLAASAFIAGSTTFSQTWTPASKQTAPRSLRLRATDADGVGSATGTETAMTVRSGRLVLAHAYGPVDQPLQVPLRVEYWSGNTWQPSVDDSCTAPGLGAAQVVVSHVRGADGSAGSGQTSVTGLSLSAGVGSLSLAAPTPAGRTATFELTLNLGGTGNPRSCRAQTPGSSGSAAGLGWLRSRWGSCANGWDSDPTATVTFGIARTDSQRATHIQDLP
ncbi:MAG: hypothetical protein RIQ53_656 [Pseudomonadota bacterium]